MNRICIIGTGLIGCSFSLALKEAGFTGHVVGCSRMQHTLDAALATGAIDSATTAPEVAVKNADLVFIAVPMLSVCSVLLAIRDAISPLTVLTDGGSVKGAFIEEAREILGSLRQVVPGHPLAGKELSGAAAAQADLYRGKRVLLTPVPETSREACESVAALWELTGANVEIVDPVIHDRLLAATSHLPHVLAYGLVDFLASKDEREDIFRYAASGFRDFTRIAASDPTMWRDICLTNANEINAVLGELIENLVRLKGSIQERDGDAIFDSFARAKVARDRHSGES